LTFYKISGKIAKDIKTPPGKAARTSYYKTTNGASGRAKQGLQIPDFSLTPPTFPKNG